MWLQKKRSKMCDITERLGAIRLTHFHNHVCSLKWFTEWKCCQQNFTCCHICQIFYVPDRLLVKQINFILYISVCWFVKGSIGKEIWFKPSLNFVQLLWHIGRDETMMCDLCSDCVNLHILNRIVQPGSWLGVWSDFLFLWIQYKLILLFLLMSAIKVGELL